MIPHPARFVKGEREILFGIFYGRWGYRGRTASYTDTAMCAFSLQSCVLLLFFVNQKGYTKGCMLPTGPAKSEYMPSTWFSLTELVHRFDISRADFEAAVEQCGKYNGTTFDIDRIFDGYEELMRLQADEDLYPVEVDRLCWIGPAWAPGSADDGSPEQIENPPDDPDTPVEEAEVVPGADEELVRGIDQIIYPE